MYHKSNIELLDHFAINGFSVLKVSTALSPLLEFTILLLYRKKDLPIEQFLEALEYFSSSRNIDIVVGDFNLKPNAILSQTMNNYEQVVLEATHLGGCILDHVYIKKSLLEQLSVLIEVKSLFFSDHEAVRICLKKKVT